MEKPELTPAKKEDDDVNPDVTKALAKISANGDLFQIPTLWLCLLTIITAALPALPGLQEPLTSDYTNHALENSLQMGINPVLLIGWLVLHLMVGQENFVRNGISGPYQFWTFLAPIIGAAAIASPNGDTDLNKIGILVSCVGFITVARLASSWSHSNKIVESLVDWGMIAAMELFIINYAHQFISAMDAEWLWEVFMHILPRILEDMSK